MSYSRGNRQIIGSPQDPRRLRAEAPPIRNPNRRCLISFPNRKRSAGSWSQRSSSREPRMKGTTGGTQTRLDLPQRAKPALPVDPATNQSRPLRIGIMLRAVDEYDGAGVYI